MASSKPILCRLHIHFWSDAKNAEGGRYALCTRCGKDDYRGEWSPDEGPNWPGKAW